MYSSDIWKREISPLLDVRLNWNDKLELNDGTFQLTKGTVEELNGLSILEPEIVYEQLNALITKTAHNHLTHLKTLENPYEDTSDFKREFKQLGTLLTDLKKPYIELLSEHAQFFNEIAEFKNTLEKPKDRPWKSIEYNERTEIDSIKKTPSKRTPVSEIIKAATQALNLAEPKIHASLECCVQPVFCCLSLLSCLKVMCWNPCERYRTGKIETRSPLKFAIDGFMDENRHIQAYQRFAAQLLNSETITEEAALGFAKLAPCANTLDLSNANGDQILQSNLSILLNATSKSQLCNTVHFSQSLLLNTQVQNFLFENQFIPLNEQDNFSTFIRRPIY